MKKGKLTNLAKEIVCILIAGILCFSLCSCGAGNGAANKSAGSGSTNNEESVNAPEETEEHVAEEEPRTLLYELDNGSLEYKNYQYAGNGFFGNADGDPSKTIILEFEYTNKSDEGRNYTSDFWIEAYQNGQKLDDPGSYNPEGVPQSFKAAIDPVGKGGSVLIGRAFTLQDYSPIQIEVRNNGGTAPSQSMLLEIEPYADTSFDINRLYGSWEDENTGKTLTLTSSYIEFGDSKSHSSSKNPRLWTDEHSLHTNFSNIGDVLEIKEDGDTLRMENETVSLVQTDNWPENENAAGGEENGKAVAKVLSMDEGLSLDFVEMSFDDSGIEDSIKTSKTTGDGGNSGGNITHTVVIESENPGTKYIYLQGTIENLSSSVIEDDNLKVKLVIDDEYEFEPKITFIAGGSSKHSIEPMNNAMFILDTGISESAAAKIEKAVWYFGFEEEFKPKNRTGSIESSEYYYQLYTIGEPKDSEEAADDSKGTDDSGEGETEAEPEEDKVQEVKLEHKALYTNLTYNNYDCVRIVQEALNDAGYSCGTPDGIAGEGTEGAIREFQADHGLEETGEVTDELIDALGCWDEADLCFYIRTTSDMEGKEPTSHFAKADQWHHWISFADRGRMREMTYYIKCESTQGFVNYPEATSGFDADGNPALGFNLWFDNPGNSPATTITTTVSDSDGNVLAKISFNVG